MKGFLLKFFCILKGSAAHFYRQLGLSICPFSSQPPSQYTSMSLQSDYVDYDIFLSKDFNPLSFANSLILSTNSPTDTEIDIATPAKRLGYDITEVQDRIASLTSSNSSSLLAEAENIQELSAAFQPLQVSVDTLSNSYAKLQRDIIDPYYKAQNIHSALRRLHTTTGLLRSLSWFLYLLRQLDSITEPLMGSHVSIAQLKSPRSARQANLYAIPNASTLFKAARTLAALERLLVIEPALRSVQIIRTYETNLLPRYETRLVLHCQNILRFYSPTSSLVASETSRTNSQSQQHQDDYDTLATYAASSLHCLKPDVLPSVLSSFIQSQSQAAVTELTRALPALNLSISAFTTAFSMAADRALFVARYQQSLKLVIPEESLTQAVEESFATWSPSPSGVNSDSRNNNKTSKFASENENGSSLVSEYWRQLATATELRLKEFAANNSSVARTVRLKQYPPATELVQQYAVAPFEKGERVDNSKVGGKGGAKDNLSLGVSAKPDPTIVRRLARSLSIVFK